MLICLLFTKMCLPLARAIRKT